MTAHRQRTIWEFMSGLEFRPSGKRYTSEERRRVRHAVQCLRSGNVFCFELLQHKVSGKMSESEYKKVKNLDIRCPLHESGECSKCRANMEKPGAIDLFQAVRDLGLYDWHAEHTDETL